MSLVLRATGGAAGACDTHEVYRALAVLADPNAGMQLQYKPFHNESYRTFAGDDLDAMAEWARQHEGKQSIYYALNPVPAELARSLNNGDVLRRHNLLIDLDRVKTAENKNEMATDAEHEAVRELAGEVRAYLDGLGWPPPVLIDSGNGFHLINRVDLPNDKLSRALVSAVLKHLAEKFDGPRGAIGVECCDARRIAKLPGTWVRKGPNSPERPHRMSHLLHVPAILETVDCGLIRETAGITSTNGQQHQPAPSSGETVIDNRPGGSLVLRAGAGSAAAYARAALERELGKMALTRPGELNPQLFRSSAALGNFIGSGLLQEEEVVQALLSVGRSAGCDDPAKDEDCVRRGIATGRETPRTAPTLGVVPPPPGAEGAWEALTVCLADVQPQKVDYLWPNRVPHRFVTVFAGRTGLGKSFVALDMVARMTKGEEIPCSGGQRFGTGGAFLISEDSHDYVLAPRLIELGANLSRIRALTWKAMGTYTLGNTDLLTKACAEVRDARLVMIDPPTNFLQGIDEHKNSEVRQTVMRVVQWVMERDLAVLFVLHVNKQHAKGIDALNRVLGSVAWVTTARVAHSFSPDPDDKTRCLFIPMKNNLGELARGLAYRIVKTPGLAKVEWLGEVNTTADEAMAGEKAKPRRVVATQWLIERFRERLEWPSDELFELARQENVSRSAIYEAKEVLKLPKARHNTNEDGSKHFTWWVPANWPPLSQNPGHAESRNSETPDS
jgi:hypothetical protein